MQGISANVTSRAGRSLHHYGEFGGAAALAVFDFRCPAVGYNCLFPLRSKAHVRLGMCAASVSTTTTAVAVNRGAVDELLPLSLSQPYYLKLPAASTTPSTWGSLCHHAGPP